VPSKQRLKFRRTTVLRKKLGFTRGSVHGLYCSNFEPGGLTWALLSVPIMRMHRGQPELTGHQVKYTYTEWVKIPPQEGGTSCAACLALFCDCRDFLAHKEEGSCPLLQHQAWIQALRQRHPTAEKRTTQEPAKEGVEPNVLEAYVLDGLRIKEEFPIPVPSVTSYACAHKVSWS
jgi:hypothetical protein